MQAAATEKKIETTKVRILRSFYFEKKPTVVDEEIVLPRIFALEVCAANKAVMVAEAEQKPEVPPAVEAAPDEAGSITQRRRSK